MFTFKPNPHRALERRARRLVADTRALAGRYATVDDDELRDWVTVLTDADDRVAHGFAAVTEAFRRRLGVKLYDVQLFGGALLWSGVVAEMATGEGKTFTAALPAATAAALGTPVHVATTNDYLAARDAGLLTPVFDAVGVAAAALTADAATPAERRAVYAADVVYATGSSFAFDYLRDNLVAYPHQRVQRGHGFIIVDEVDSILLDEARTPLIIAGPATGTADVHLRVRDAVAALDEGLDFEVEARDNLVRLTEEGMSRLEASFGVASLYAPDNLQLLALVDAALRARCLLHRDRDYIVVDGRVVIVDQSTGRPQPDRNFTDGVHQAVEAKEGVPVNLEDETVAQITYPGFLRLYRTVAGMSGTAVSAADQFERIYGLAVVPVPTNRPSRRVDHPDAVFVSAGAKWAAVVDDVVGRHRRGQPVLVGTNSVADSEIVSAALTAAGVTHTVLNARQPEREAAVVAEAGAPGAVTVATNMAGRGTDIVLGGSDGARRDEVVAAGGLFVCGTSRAEETRIDDQLRGRAGRQGDPGESRFYASFDDDVLAVFGDKAQVLSRFAGSSGPLPGRFAARLVARAQEAVGNTRADARRSVQRYGRLVDAQRLDFFTWRDRIVDGGPEVFWDGTGAMLGELTGDDGVAALTQLDAAFASPVVFPDGTVVPAPDPDPSETRVPDPGDVDAWDAAVAARHVRLRRLLVDKEAALGPELFAQVSRAAVLQGMDVAWRALQNELETIRLGSTVHAFANIDPVRVWVEAGTRRYQRFRHECLVFAVAILASAAVVPAAGDPGPVGESGAGPVNG
jgi:preprotein translocase subunit SecA